MPLHSDGKGNVVWRPSITNTSQAYGPSQPTQNYGDAGSFDLYTQAPTLDYPDSYFQMFKPQSARSFSGDGLLDKYRAFLFDSGIDPDTIGGARINRDTGRMQVPTLAQQNAAVRAKDLASAQDSRLRNAALAMAKKNPGGSAELLDLLAERRAQQGSDSEDKLSFWSRVLQNAGLRRSNGYF